MERFSYSRNGVQGRVDENCQVRVGITGVDTTSSKHVLYRVRMVNLQTRQAWEVSRRFSEFFKLRNELLAFLQAADKKCPGCVNYQKVLLRFEFPRKHIFTSDSPVVLNYRRNALTSFVALLASHTFTSSPKCPTCSGFSFTAVRDFLTEGLVVMDGNAANSPVASDDKQAVARDTIRESMNVKDFTDYHPVSSLRHVNSDGKFTSEVRVNTHKPKPKPKPATHKEHSNKHERHAKQASASKRDATHRQKSEAPLPSPPVKQRNSLSSTGSSSSDPVSPGSLPPSPQNVKKSSKKVLEYNEEEKEEDEDEGFSSFVIPKSTADKPAAVETVEVAAAQKTKKKFNFTSSPRESMERGSTINFDDDDDDDDGDDEDEDINLDFMKSVSVAKA